MSRIPIAGRLASLLPLVLARVEGAWKIVNVLWELRPAAGE